jgi:hypothetical protein
MDEGPSFGGPSVLFYPERPMLMPDPFITVTDLSDYLGRDLSADDGAVIAVDAACDIVRNAARGREFNRGTATVSLDGTGTDAIPLPNEYQPVNAAGTVTVGGTAEADFMVASNGVLLRGTAGGFPRPTWPLGRRNVTVTLDYGYDTLDIPRDVRMVALSVASRLVVQGVALEETVGDVRVKYAVASTDLTNGEKMVLVKYGGAR